MTSSFSPLEGPFFFPSLRPGLPFEARQSSQKRVLGGRGLASPPHRFLFIRVILSDLRRQWFGVERGSCASFSLTGFSGPEGFGVFLMPCTPKGKSFLPTILSKISFFSLSPDSFIGFLVVFLC